MSEYNRNGSTNGNGNGNGHDSKFGIVAKEDPMLSTVVPRARMRVCLNKKIPESARMFFCYLTDLSLTNGSNIRRGVIKFSDSALGARFGVNVKTIRNWKRWIESTGEVWLTEKWMKNSFPQTVYNITSIVGQATLPLNAESEDGSLPEDEVFSSNRRRQQATQREGSTGKFSCRAHGIAGCQICRQTPPRVPALAAAVENIQISSENEPSGKILPPTTAIDCRPPRQMVAAHRGKSLPSPTANGCRPARQMVAVADGKILPRPAANGCRGERQSVADKGKTKVGELSLSEVGGKATPPDLSFEASLKGMYPSRLEKLRAELQQKVLTAKSEPARAEWRRRLGIVKNHQLGGAVPDESPKQKPGPARAEPKASKEMTKEQLLESARNAVALGAKFLTDSQRQALQEAGE